jgi:1,2-phenylacetyl-CoA epoxidase PaaB subunit
MDARTLRDLEGRHVSVALADGTRVDDCQLVSAGRGGTTTVWLYSSRDVFVRLSDVIDIWESRSSSRRAA